ncbi:MAG: spore coat protein, partial [Myxococcaceae bacterium]|nr:spore coat protein [Myxococcaceae bacterium]
MANIMRRRPDPGALARRERGWDPFEGLQDLLRLEPFRELGFPFGAQPEAAFVPLFDVKETNEAYVFRADLPGVKESDIDVNLSGNRLTVSGKREEEKREQTDRYFTYEREYGDFSRSFTLPGGVDGDHVQAELKDGV